MKTGIKVITGVVAVLLVAVIGVGVYIHYIFDPNDYKQQVAAWVKKHSGRDLTIGGDIKLSLFPWLAVEMGHMSLSNRAGFGPKSFAEVSSVRIGVRLLPILLDNSLQTQTITLEGLTLNLGVDKSGRANWQDLVPRGDATDAGNLNKKVTAGTGQGIDQYLSALAIGGVHIGRARINWDDRLRNRRVTVDHLNLTSGPILPRQPFPLKMTFNLAAQPAAIQGQVQVHGMGLIEPLKGDYRLDRLHITLDATGKGLPVTPFQAKLRGGVGYDVKKRRLALSDLFVEALGATLTGKINAIQLLHSPAATGEVQIRGLNLRSLLDLAAAQPILTEDSDVLGPVTARINFDANSQHVNISYLHADIDDSTVNGIIEVSEFDHPNTKFELYLDSLDLDRYLPPASSAAAAPATPAAAAAAGAGRLPLRTLRALRLDGKVQVGEFKAARMHMRDATLFITARDGQIALRPAASLYGGRYRGDIGIDARGAQLRLSFDEALQGVHLAPLLTDFTGDDLVTGDADLHAKFSLTGDPARFRRSLNGRASFKLSNGTIEGINVARIIREARARLEGRSLAAPGPLHTDFSELSGTVTADNGVLRNNDLSVKTPFLRIAGKGEVDLASEDVDYHIDAKIVATPAGQGGEDLQGLKGVSIPIHVSGTIAKLTFAPDLRNLITQEAAKRLQKELQKRPEAPGGGNDRPANKRLDQLKGRLKENLEKLFQH